MASEVTITAFLYSDSPLPTKVAIDLEMSSAPLAKASPAASNVARALTPYLGIGSIL